MARVYVGIGSNIEPERNIPSGLATLRRQFGPLTVSTIYSNPAVGFTGDDFFNLVVGFDTDLSVHTVVARLRKLEAAHQDRRDGPKIGPRALDLDLLLYDDLVLRQNGLCIPRDDITRHAFVLRPLAEVAGDRLHPVLGATFAELWAALDHSRERLRAVVIESRETGGWEQVKT